SAPRSGLVILISDFLDKHGYETGLKHLLHKRCEVCAIQVLAEEELSPELAGDLRLVDSEDGSSAEVTVTQRLLRNYRDVMRRYSAGLRTFCIKRGINFIPAVTSSPFEELVLKSLKMSGLVR